MSSLSKIAAACRRTGIRLVASGALAVGLLSTAPAVDARGATHHRGHHGHHHAHHHAHLGPSAPRVARAIDIAVHQKGDPYVYGAAGPGAFDCSGLTYYAFRHAGFGSIPRTSAAQSHFARHISRSNMHRGDLMFFYGNGGVYHVGIFAGIDHGRRLVLHAPYPGTRVRTEPVWTNAWFPGTLRYR